MSKPRSEIRARAANRCKKKPYPSAVAAYEALLAQTMSAAIPLRAYRCPICPQTPEPVYHLTSQPRRPTRPGGAGRHLGGEAA